MTPFWSMLATAGVSELQVMVVGTTTLFGSRTVAKIWSWKPTGSAGSLGSRPLKLMLLPGGGGGPLPLHAPKVAAAECQTSEASRCSDRPTAAEACAAMMSVESSPAAGPLEGVNVPS